MLALPHRLLVVVLIENMQNEIKEIKSLLESIPEKLERIIFRNGDDVAVSIARSFERLEERIDAAESRIYSQLGKLDDELKAVRLIVEGDSEVVIAEA